MKLNSKKYRKFLSQSILLEERGAPEVLRIILLFLVLLLGLFLLWSTKVELKETVPAQGELIPGEGLIILETPRMGVLEGIFVTNNQLVQQGDIILKLQDQSLLISLEEEQIRSRVLRLERNALREELATLEPLRQANLISVQEYQGVQSDLIQVEGSLSVSLQKQRRLELELEDFTITAPASGRIHNLESKHSGSVVHSGETICQILPEDQVMVAEIIIDPRFRGRINPGQTVELQFLSYEYGRFGGMEVELREISGSTYLDSHNTAYYKAYAELPQNYIDYQDVHYPLILGMPLNAEILTGSKTLIQYLVHPVKASLRRAFREE